MIRLSVTSSLRDFFGFAEVRACAGSGGRRDGAGSSEKSRNSPTRMNRSLDRTDSDPGSGRGRSLVRRPTSEEWVAMGFLDSRQGGSPDRRGQDGPRRLAKARVPGVEDLESRTLLAAGASNLVPIGTPPAA